MFKRPNTNVVRRLTNRAATALGKELRYQIKLVLGGYAYQKLASDALFRVPLPR